MPEKYKKTAEIAKMHQLLGMFLGFSTNRREYEHLIRHIVDV